jgi:hypothetical protein
MIKKALSFFRENEGFDAWVEDFAIGFNLAFR